MNEYANLFKIEYGTEFYPTGYGLYGPALNGLKVQRSASKDSIGLEILLSKKRVQELNSGTILYGRESEIRIKSIHRLENEGDYYWSVPLSVGNIMDSLPETNLYPMLTNNDDKISFFILRNFLENKTTFKRTLFSEELKGRINDDIQGLQKPLNISDIDYIETDFSDYTAPMTTGIYSYLKKGQNLQKLFERLGLGRKFKEKYPTDSDFWEETRSLLEVYKDLSNI